MKLLDKKGNVVRYPTSFGTYKVGTKEYDNLPDTNVIRQLKALENEDNDHSFSGGNVCISCLFDRKKIVQAKFTGFIKSFYDDGTPSEKWIQGEQIHYDCPECGLHSNASMIPLGLAKGIIKLYKDTGSFDGYHEVIKEYHK